MMVDTSGNVTFPGTVHCNSVDSGTITSLSNRISAVGNRTTNLENRATNLETISTVQNFFSTTADAISHDLLNIDISNRYSAINRTTAFYLGDGKSFANVPSGMPGNCSAIREVYWVDKENIFVKITEFSPTPGKTYCNAYVKNTWKGWVVR